MMNHAATNDGMFEDQKTSLSAIIGFVLSLVGCCLPTGILGVVLGVFGLIGIGRSGGRVGGKGLAIAAIIIGVLNTVIQIGLVVGALAIGRQMNNAGADVQTVITSVEQGDYDGARAVLVGPLSNMTDEELAAFGDEMAATHGTFGSLPNSLGELVVGWMEAGQQMQQFQGRNDIIPIPARFSSGRVLLLYTTDPSGQVGPGKNFPAPLIDVIVLGVDGTTVTLSDYAGTAPDSAPDSAANSESSEDNPEENPETDTGGGG